VKKKILFSWFVLISLFVSSFAFAEQSYDLKEMTPKVTKALENRKARYSELQKLKSEGTIGESKQGFLDVFLAPLEISKIVLDENRDRKVIYQAIVDQNDLGPAGMGKIQEVFAEVQRGKARPGEKIQLSSGEWIQKT
jgi:uncharacterized protein YdbL (DUF1318 family)